jgi:hypothetical protein
MAHAERNQVTAAYVHAEYLPQRREMMSEMGRLPRAPQNRNRSDADQHGGATASRILVAEVPQRDYLVHISANVIRRSGDVKTLIRDRRTEHEK